MKLLLSFLKKALLHSIAVCILSLFNIFSAYSTTHYLSVGNSITIDPPSASSANGYIDQVYVLQTYSALDVQTSYDCSVKITVKSYFDNIVTVKLRFVEKYTYLGHIGKVDHDMDVNISCKFVKPTSVTLPDVTVAVGSAKEIFPTIYPSDATVTKSSWSQSSRTFFGGSARQGHYYHVTGKAIGTGTVTVVLNDNDNLTATCKVTVVDPDNMPPTHVSIPEAKRISVGGMVRLTPTLLPENSSTTYKWTSDNETVATVDYGEIIGQRIGTANITVRTANGLTATCQVTVSSTGPFDDEEDEDFTGSVDGYEYVDLGLSVKWATYNVGASKPEDFGSYFAWGETTEKSSYSWSTYAYGTYMNEVYIGTDIKGTKYDAANVKWGNKWRMPDKAEFRELYNKCTVNKVTKNSVNGYEFIGNNGASIFLPDAGYYAPDHRGGCTYWSSELSTDPGKAGYLLIYVNKGEILEYTQNGMRMFGMPIRPVTEASGQSSKTQLQLSASPSGGEVEKGTKVTLSADVSGADIYYTLDGSIPSKNSEYYSSAIAIDESLTLKAIAYKEGYYSSDVLTEYYTIKSSSIQPTSISVSPSSKTIKVGDTFTATYTLSPSNATTTVTWTSDDSSIASVDYYGKVKGIKEGTAYIYATTSNNKSDYCKVTVTNPIEEIKVTKITLNYSSPLSLTVGDTREFSAYVSPYDATDKTVSWLSSNSTVASVDKDGLVEAKSKGTATITCKANDGSGIQATCEITVESVKNWSYFKAKTAEGVEMQFYVEKVSDGVCKVSGSPAIDNNTTGSITIPNEVEGLKVTGVGYAAFKDCAGITSVIVPSTVTKIESNAFNGCTNLNNVSLGNNVEDLGSSVFWGCSSLDKITGINKLESIGSSAFRLEEYNTYIPWYNNLPDGLLYLGKVLYKYKGRMPDGTTVNVSEGTTQIGQDCFEDCEGLVAITIPRSVKSIGYYIFDGCTNLTSISVDSSNDKYDSRSNCDAIIDTNNNTVIAGCKNTTFPSTIKAIGSGAFYGSGLTEAVIPNNIDSIANNAFAYSRSLTSVIIGKGTRVIGKDDNPFIGCLKLNNITVANGNPHYDSRDNCNAIIEKASGTLIVGCPATVIPLSVKAIGRNSFYNYNDMFTLTIPDNVEKINQYAVEYVYSLRALTLGKGIKDIGTRAFYGCRNLRVIHSLAKDPIELEESVFSCNSEYADSVYKSATLYVPVGSRINYMTTSGWNKFKKIEEISDDTRLSFSINSADGGKLTFMVTDVKAKTCELIAINKDAMGEITVPSQADGYIVVGIGYDTFYNIPNITKVNLPNTINYFGSYAFYKCEDLESLELPSSLESIGYFALGSTKLKEIVIPSSVSRIDKGIFTANRELTSVIVDKRNPWYDSRGNCNAVIERTSNTLVAGCKATVIPHDVERIGDYAFNSLPLINIDLPNSLTSIGESAFNNNKELEKIILPSSLTHIGTEAFRLCVNLSKVYSYIQIPFNINESVFRSTYPTDVDRFATTTLYVPNGTKSLYKSTDGWKLFQNIVEFDSSNINNLRMDSNRDSSIYDLFGRKINKPRKGINIIGGKKVVIK